jgi:hypothetical protein
MKKVIIVITQSPKKIRAQKGFFTSKGIKTIAAVMAYYYYFFYYPDGIDTLVPNEDALMKTTKILEERYGLRKGANIWPMLLCGMSDNWVNSDTASGRAVAMHDAKIQALQLIVSKTLPSFPF